jgi:hypothetical protein
MRKGLDEQAFSVNAGERTRTSKGFRPPAPKAPQKGAAPGGTGRLTRLERVYAASAHRLLPNVLPT